MENPKYNSLLPVTHYGRKGVQVPLDQAIQNPQIVLNTTPKTYLPKPANQLPPKENK
jgi:hypothetical protein